MTDPVLETLSLGLETLNPPLGAVLFYPARLDFDFAQLKGCDVTNVQSFRPEVLRLEAAGQKVATRPDDDAAFDLIIHTPHRQRQKARADLARIVTMARDGGVIMVAASNLEGAKTHQSDLESLIGPVQSLSKNKCRVFWGTVGDQVDTELLQEWLTLDAPIVPEHGLLSRPGLFSWDRADKGSLLLLQNLPPLSGKGADFGCGYGFLMEAILAQNEDLRRLDGLEADHRAVDMARHNMAKWGERARALWADVLSEVTETYDFIVSNPPFHTDRADNHALGQGFIASAGRALKKGGAFYMVANRHLPYEATLKTHFKTVVLLTEQDGFKVYKAVK